VVVPRAAAATVVAAAGRDVAGAPERVCRPKAETRMKWET
jgi:hypothetical protein